MNEAFKQERRRAKEQQSSGDIASTSSIDGSEVHSLQWFYCSVEG